MKTKWTKYWILVVALSIIPLAIIAAFIQYNSEDFYNLTSADWLAFSGAAISYIGTIGISLVALYQSERANMLSEQVFALTQREYIVNFSVEKIKECTIKGCKHTNKNHISFCEVDITPETCKGYFLTIRNYSNYPIVHMHISSSYPVGRKRMLETLEQDKDILLGPHEAQEFLICNATYFAADGMGIKFSISCSNLFNNSSALEIQLGKEIDAEGHICFSTKLGENENRDCESSR